MTIRVQSVPRLADVVDPVVGFLDAPGELFETRHLVVPTLGVRAWLTAELATRLGATGRGDGVVANVSMHLPGSLRDFLSPRGIDAWSIPAMTWALLEILSSDDRFAAVVERTGGPLLAARAMADRFDRYHARRPAMVRSWESGVASLGPNQDDPIRDGMRLSAPLGDADRWQFDLWREVRDRIGELSPPARPLVRHEHTPERLLLAGLQTLTPGQVELLAALADGGDVEVVLVHPSPALAQRRPAVAPDAERLTPTRAEPVLDAELDPLVQTWLRDSEETATLLAIHGIAVHEAGGAGASGGGSLLQRLQRSVRAARRVDPPAACEDDRSIVVHRCHDLGRQVEVLRDALLHAVAELPDLAPHEVVILCPDVSAAAPLLGAVFGDDEHEWLRVVVADRGLREVSEGASVLATLLKLVGSRYGVADVVELAAMPLVLAHLGLSSDAPEVWARHVEEARVRWGLDVDQRGRVGLDGVDVDAHTWHLGLERMVLGALVPDGGSATVAGEVAPLPDVEGSELDDIAGLLVVLRVLGDLDRVSDASRPVGEWATLLEGALVALCGDSSGEVEPALRILAEFAEGAPLSPVPLEDVRDLLIESLSSVPGRQPLRTGAITATSMIPLRGVPFRVVCVLGFDEAALSTSEGEGDDLVERVRLVGDRDSRHEVRRALLDAMLAASDRLIVTCTGRDVRNNQPKHLVTPLVEFVDFAVRHGARLFNDSDGTRRSEIEVVHPRHAASPANFVDGAVVPGLVWSHSTSALAAARAMGRTVEPVPVAVAASSADDRVTVEQLEALVVQPLSLFAKDTLGLRRRFEGEVAPGAVIPLALGDFERQALAADYMQRLLAGGADRSDVRDEWTAGARRSGSVPIGAAGDAEVDWVTNLVEEMLASAARLDAALESRTTKEITLSVGGSTIVGRIGGVVESGDVVRLVDVDFRSGGSDAFRRSKPALGVRLLLACATGPEGASALSLMRHNTYPKSGVVMTREIVTEYDADVARQRLSELAELARFALSNPCPMFGSTVSSLAAGDEESARQQFDAFLRGQSFGGSFERRIYGSSPRFDEVFHRESPESHFVELSSKLLRLVDSGSGKPRRYLLS